MSDLATKFTASLSGLYNSYLYPNLSAAGETIGEYCTIIANSRITQSTCSVATSFFGALSKNYPSSLKFSWSTGTAVACLGLLLALGTLLPKPPTTNE